MPPSQLQPKTPRDLETICLKCLQKEPARRYESAAALAEDLRRFQAGEPIRARPVTVLERGLKWVRRNKAISIALAATVLALVGGTAVATWQAVVAKVNQTRAEEKRDLAERLVYAGRLALARRRQ